MRYVEHPAPAEFASLVRCIWIFEATFDAPHEERIVPDGCPEIILHFGNPYLERDDAGRWRAQPPLLLAGNLTRPLVLRSEGKVGVLGIRLWPQAVRHLVSGNVTATLDTRQSLRLSGVEQRRREIAKAVDDDERVRLAANVLVTLFKADNVANIRNYATVDLAVAEIFASRGQVSPEALAQNLDLSLRQLERRMKHGTGLSAKALASLVRFRAVFDELNADVPSPWLNAAMAAGYFDQAHMIRDFKRYAGQPPRAFLANAGALSTSIVSSR